MSLSALIFDVDGTLADTEEAHRLAFNATFSKAGLDWEWGAKMYTHLLLVTGGKERIRFFLEGLHPDVLLRDDIDDLIADLHRQKTEFYVAAIKQGRVPLRPGVEQLLLQARDQGVRLAIATTTTPVNLQSLIESTLGAQALDWFDAIGAGDCVNNLKPAPDVYLWVLDRLNLSADQCLAIEDSANGLKAATDAGLKCLITSCPYTEHHDFDGAIDVRDSLDGVDIKQLQDRFA
jgi:beta-phosphoglucomutase-like phosphatase (HAD superfamily)